MNCLVLRFVLKSVTPIWTGGMVTGSCAPAPKLSGLVGSLRAWAALSPKIKFCGRECTYEPNHPENLCDVCWAFGITGWARRFRPEVVGLDLNQDRYPAFWPVRDAQFELICYVRRDHAPRVETILTTTLETISSHGGFGARTQHGYGQVRLIPAPQGHSVPVPNQAQP